MFLKNHPRRRLLMGAAAGLALPASAALKPTLRTQLQALVDNPAAPLAGLSVLVQRAGRTVFEAQFGRRTIAPSGRDDLPVTADTLFRVASVSKIVVALGVMRLVEVGRLSLDADIGEALGYPVRHPRYPDVVVTSRLLLSHRSSLSDNAGEYLEPGQSMKAALSDTASLRWAPQMPGAFFQYCNLNFGVLASVIERASGQRFDRFAREHVLGPLGMQGDFDAFALSPEQLANVATLYRKFDGNQWMPRGPWVAQTDDFHNAPPQPKPGLAVYQLGSNGSLFGPQGGLRTRVRDLARLMAMLNAGGVLDDGQRFLTAASVRAMTTEQWRLDSDAKNGDDLAGEFQAWGVGLQHFIDQSRPGWGDRLVPGGGQQAWGHLGFAWGLQAGLMFDPAHQTGIVYVISGTGLDPDAQRGKYSSFAPWEERMQGLLWGVVR
ncbi:MAG: beta-lactamase family protein [Burkholderiaceae bacterium]|nr:beta-lactamase family protein [Burkholderiaceae bacterium]